MTKRNPRQIGSQYRETLKESGNKIVRRISRNEVILQTPDGELELWFKNDHASGAVIEIGKTGYEFFRSLSKATSYNPKAKAKNRMGGNPMVKERSKQMKILGMPILTAAIVGGLAYWLLKKK